MAWARASELDRALNCVASNRLAHIRVPTDNATKAADWGTAVHTWKEGGDFLLDMGTEKTFAKKLVRTGDFRPEFWPSTGTHEQAFSFNCLTGEVDSRTGSRAALEKWKAEHGDEFVTGTADFTDELLGMLWVDDLKTGQYAPDPVNGQMFFYCMCLQLWETGELKEDVLSSITHWPKYPLDGYPDRKQALLPVARLLKFRDVLVAGYHRWKDWNNELVPGPQCFFCPADCGYQGKEIE